MPNFNEIIFWDNSLTSYMISGLVFLAGIFAINFVYKRIVNRIEVYAKKKNTNFVDFVLSVFKKTVYPLFYYALMVGSINILKINDDLDKFFKVIGYILLTVAIVRFIMELIDYWLKVFQKKHNNDQAQIKGLRGLITVVKIIIWSLAVMFVLKNLGYDVDGAIAGLGITGIAVALAAQKILGDLFSYFSILFDKPFEPGDFIIIDEYMGTIEHIGIKTTRLESLTGEQLIISNSDLTSSRLRNYKRMKNRRISFDVNIVYETPHEVLSEVPSILEKIAKSVDRITFDRAHFSGYGDFSLVFTVVYYVNSSDYRIYMDVQQEINYKIFEEFSNRNIEFAYPTQKIFMDSTRN